MSRRSPHIPRMRTIIAAFVIVSGTAGNTELQAQDAPTTWGFFNARYDTRTSNFIYAGYGYDRYFAFGGVLANPRSGYFETLGGIGAIFALTRRTNHMFGLAAAQAPESRYAQLYYLPTLRLGRATARATLEWYFPMEDTGVRQFGVSPASVTMPVARRVELGAAMELASAAGASTSVELGPEVRIAIPRATLGFDAFAHVSGGDGRRVRAFLNASF